MWIVAKPLFIQHHVKSWNPSEIRKTFHSIPPEKPQSSNPIPHRPTSWELMLWWGRDPAVLLATTRRLKSRNRRKWRQSQKSFRCRKDRRNWAHSSACSFSLVSELNSMWNSGNLWIYAQILPPMLFYNFFIITVTMHDLRICEIPLVCWYIWNFRSHYTVFTFSFISPWKMFWFIQNFYGIFYKD